MQTYAALHGDTGVSAYELRADGIAIRFTDGSTYLYTEASAGRKQVREMKRLAASGRGLTTFINQQVRDQYAEKLR